jgi:myo-inositol 2-dehydrogenase/D-chiro-inositol 1-dehydrogenase
VLHLSSGRLAPRALGERMNGTSSVLFYLGVHDADLACWLSGRDIARVYARAVRKRLVSAGVDSEDAIFTTCELEGGAVAQLHAGWTLPDDAPAPVNARTMVVGAQGTIEIDVRDHGLRVHDADGYRQPDALHWPSTGGRRGGDLVEQLRHFVGAIARDEPFRVGVDDALRAVAVNDAILRSVASGRPEDVEPWSIA